MYIVSVENIIYFASHCTRATDDEKPGNIRHLDVRTVRLRVVPRGWLLLFLFVFILPLERQTNVGCAWRVKGEAEVPLACSHLYSLTSVCRLLTVC